MSIWIITLAAVSALLAGLLAVALDGLTLTILSRRPAQRAHATARLLQ